MLACNLYYFLNKNLPYAINDDDDAMITNSW